ncbi:MAG: N-acetyl-gamma-glutamyl-phosphate reductase [Myxococcota bacterium]
MNAQRTRAIVLGGTGYGGAEMIRRLLQHPQVELVGVGSIDHLGEPVSRVHPNLEGRTQLQFQRYEPDQVAEAADVALLGLPHDVSLEVLPALLERGCRVVDMSAAFRLDDAETYRARYDRAHPRPELLPRCVYGLPELHRSRIAEATAVASPGCFATCVELALWPLAQAGLLKGEVRVVAMTGSSGAGASTLPTTHHPVRSVTLRPYAALRHVQSFEMAEQLEAAGATDLSFDFVPVSAPLGRGILAVAQLSVPEAWTEVRLRELLASTYASERFVRVPGHRDPEVGAVAGSNYAEVGVRVGAPRDGRRSAAVFGALDNLIKGGAGQAIQSMNLMLGFDEATSLEDPGHYP